MPLLDRKRPDAPVSPKPQTPALQKAVEFVKHLETLTPEELEALKDQCPDEVNQLQHHLKRTVADTPLSQRMQSKNPTPVTRKLKPVVATPVPQKNNFLSRTIDTSLKPAELHHHKLFDACNKCELLCKSRQRVVLWRGEIPCQVLFIGEAPGQSEDQFGVPFVGPAGQLLEEIIRECSFQAFSVEKGFTYAATNMVCCRPLSPQGRNRPPTAKETSNCASRLYQFVCIAQPQVIITVGRIAQQRLNYEVLKRITVFPPGNNALGFTARGRDAMPPQPLGSLKVEENEFFPHAWEPLILHIMHPSAMLQAEDVGLEKKRAVMYLAAKLGEFFSDERIPF